MLDAIQPSNSLKLNRDKFGITRAIQVSKAETNEGKYH
jgi:hypothetical protein